MVPDSQVLTPVTQLHLETAHSSTCTVTPPSTQRQPRPGPLSPDPSAVTHKKPKARVCLPAHTQVHRHWQGCPHRLGRYQGQHLSYGHKGALCGRQRRVANSPLLSPRGHPRFSFHAPCPAWPALLKPGGGPGAAAMEEQLSRRATQQGQRASNSPTPAQPRAPGHQGTFLFSGRGCSCPLRAYLHRGNKQTHSTNPGETKKIIFFILGPGSST